MTMSVSSDEVVGFDQIDADAATKVGGKALGLSVLKRAGLPVPAGFCITTSAHCRLRGGSLDDDVALCDSIFAAYRQLGGGVVAVRSSAPVEDAAFLSSAGQYETILNVAGEAALLQAIRRCWNSLFSARARAYRRRNGLAEEDLAMAVIVQRQVNSEIAGVLFTRDPTDSDGRGILIEASWGLGESVAAGRVTPDRYHIDRATGVRLDQQLGVKSIMATNDGWRDVAPELQRQACLSEPMLLALAQLGRRVEACCGQARDVEWAWADGRFWLLQARPITTAGAAEREQVRCEEMARLREIAAPSGTVWSRFNLCEILPAPTPMTWSVVRRFLSGKGGYGLMYRDLGFDPDPSLDDECIYDLICGRPYCNLSREPRMQYRRLPFEHPIAAMKVDPARALNPRPVLNPARADWRFWFFLPWTTMTLLCSATLLRQQSRTFAARFRTEILPRFLQTLEQERAIDDARLSTAELYAQLDRLIQMALFDYARDSLKPTVFAALALGSLERSFNRTVGSERTQVLLRKLVMGVRPDPDADLAQSLQALMCGQLAPGRFLEQFGHRGNLEMELSEPRWNETPDAIERWCGASVKHDCDPATDETALWQDVAAEAKLPTRLVRTLAQDYHALRTYVSLRETAKHHLMKGYALIRRVMLNLDSRTTRANGIFFLSLQELPLLLQGEHFARQIAERRQRRALALSIEVPAVLFSDDLEAIGRPTPVSADQTWQGVPLSAGVAEGEALVLDDPEDARPPPRPYVLVCPSTDPAWVPLFVQAQALVMETGGILSHGAIVAREFGIPAIAGLPGIMRRIRNGQRLTVNGNNGRLMIHT